MDTYSPEEFVKSLKRRGLVTHIADARKYVEQTGKDSYTEDDFMEAYHHINSRPMGRTIIRKQGDGRVVYTTRDKYGMWCFAGAEE